MIKLLMAVSDVFDWIFSVVWSQLNIVHFMFLLHLQLPVLPMNYIFVTTSYQLSIVLVKIPHIELRDQLRFFCHKMNWCANKMPTTIKQVPMKKTTKKTQQSEHGKCPKPKRNSFKVLKYVDHEPTWINAAHSTMTHLELPQHSFGDIAYQMNLISLQGQK